LTAKLVNFFQVSVQPPSNNKLSLQKIFLSDFYLVDGSVDFEVASQTLHALK